MRYVSLRDGPMPFPVGTFREEVIHITRSFGLGLPHAIQKSMEANVRREDALVKKSPIFYGWIIFLVGTLGLILTSPGQTYAVSIFIEYFIGDLGISRSLVSTLFSLGTLVGSLTLPWVGWQIDRRGPRRMVVVIALLFGLACIFMGFVRNAVMLGLGFFAIRMLGQGSLELVCQNVINQWWVRRRGFVLGMSGLVVALLGLGAFPLLIHSLIPHFGWRGTYMLLGGLLIGVMLPLGALLFRPRPEIFGLQPDGIGPVSDHEEDTLKPPEEEDWTLAEAMRTPVFWTMGLGLAVIAMMITGLTFHQVSIFADNGLSATVAASAFVPFAVTTAIVNLGGGVLSDRSSPRVLLAVALVFQTIAMGLAQFLSGVELAMVYGLVLGITMGLNRVVISVGWATYFGRRNLGSITGTVTTIVIFGSALGPMPLGFARDLWGGYGMALTILSVLPIGLAIANLVVGQPQKSGLNSSAVVADGVSSAGN